MNAPSPHRADAPASVRVFVLTISDTRSEANDSSGAAIVEALTAAGHTVSGRRILRDDPGPVASAVRGATVSADAIITTGGTGITSGDSTFEAIAQLSISASTASASCSACSATGRSAPPRC